MVSSNTGTADLVTWPLKCKLVESMEYTDAWFMQQGFRCIEGLTHFRLYCCRYYFVWQPLSEESFFSILWLKTIIVKYKRLYKTLMLACSVKDCIKSHLIIYDRWLYLHVKLNKKSIYEKIHFFQVVDWGLY